MKKKMPKLMMGVILTSMVLSSGLSAAAAEVDTTEENIAPTAVPLEVSMNPKNTRGLKGETTKSVDYKLNWGGGATGTYSVNWHNGLKVETIPALNAYDLERSVTYSLGSLPSHTWKTYLEVRNGEFKRIDGTVYLTR